MLGSNFSLASIQIHTWIECIVLAVCKVMFAVRHARLQFAWSLRSANARKHKNQQRNRTRIEKRKINYDIYGIRQSQRCIALVALGNFVLCLFRENENKKKTVARFKLRECVELRGPPLQSWRAIRHLSTSRVWPNFGWHQGASVQRHCIHVIMLKKTKMGPKYWIAIYQENRWHIVSWKTVAVIQRESGGHAINWMWIR